MKLHFFFFFLFFCVYYYFLTTASTYSLPCLTRHACFPRQDSKLGCTESKSAANPSRRSEQRICACCGMASLKVPRADTIQSVSELSGRKKVTLSPGHSLMDWIRLGRSQGDLSGVKDKRTDMTLADLATHNHPNDMWMALRGECCADVLVFFAKKKFVKVSLYL